jgi:hypothetical protein
MAIHKAQWVARPTGHRESEHRTYALVLLWIYVRGGADPGNLLRPGRARVAIRDTRAFFISACAWKVARPPPIKQAAHGLHLFAPAAAVCTRPLLSHACC